MTGRLNLPTLIDRYGSEDECRAELEELRWPDGVRCTKCESDRVSRVTTRDTWRCLDCGMHFSVRAGTVLQDSKLPLRKWMLATYIVCESEKGVSSNQLKRMLGVSYKTAWFLSHRIRAAMGKVHREQLSGIVAVGEAIHTDEYIGYDGIGDDDTAHETVNHRQKEYVRGDVHTNTIESVWSLFKRSVIGTHHHMSVKHLPAYLDEIAFKYNNRDNTHIFRETLRVIVSADPMTYADLIED